MHFFVHFQKVWPDGLVTWHYTKLMFDLLLDFSSQSNYDAAKTNTPLTSLLSPIIVVSRHPCTKIHTIVRAL